MDYQNLIIQVERLSQYQIIMQDYISLKFGADFKDFCSVKGQPEMGKLFTTKFQGASFQNSEKNAGNNGNEVEQIEEVIFEEEDTCSDIKMEYPEIDPLASDEVVEEVFSLDEGSNSDPDFDPDVPSKPKKRKKTNTRSSLGVKVVKGVGGSITYKSNDSAVLMREHEHSNKKKVGVNSRRQGDEICEDYGSLETQNHQTSNNLELPTENNRIEDNRTVLNLLQKLVQDVKVVKLGLGNLERRIEPNLTNSSLIESNPPNNSIESTPTNNYSHVSHAIEMESIPISTPIIYSYSKAPPQFVMPEPFVDKDAFDLFDNSVPDVEEEIKRVLIFCGGDTLSKAVNLMLRKIMGDELAANYSLWGKKNNHNFSITNFFKVMKDVIFARPELKGDEKSIEKAVSEWLRHGSDRLGQKRKKGKNKEQS